MTHTTYRIWYEQPDACWFAQSPEHPVLSAFGDTPLAALHELMIVLGQQKPLSKVAIISAPVVRPEFGVDYEDDAQ